MFPALSDIIWGFDVGSGLRRVHGYGLQSRPVAVRAYRYKELYIQLDTALAEYSHGESPPPGEI